MDPTPTPPLKPAPESREELLAAVDPQRRHIYDMARQIIDDLEMVAPWEALYYPPTEEDEFYRVQTGLLEVIEGIPQHVAGLSVRFMEDLAKAVIDRLPPAMASDSAKQVIKKLIDGSAAGEVKTSTIEAAKRGVDRMPAKAADERLKATIKALIDRESEELAPYVDPATLDETIDELPPAVVSDSARETLRNAQFFFHGMNAMISTDLDKLVSLIGPYLSGESASPPTPEEREYVCEVGSDLKGKYCSSIMGAAANLIAAGRWESTEIEPILFPEKAAEFERNEQLVATLQEVIAAIKHIPEEVPFGELIAAWEGHQRADRYALTHLYVFLGDLGKLMKESSRRALYSGDYHKVQQRESRLSTRVNELNTLHGMVWGIVPLEGVASVEAIYPLMIRKTHELAAILDGEILKDLIGEKLVRDILEVLTLEGELKKLCNLEGPEAEAKRNRLAHKAQDLRQEIPEHLQSLIELLSEEDLQTFLELLLGSVLKRASFALKKKREEEAVEAPPPEPPEVPEVLPEPLPEAAVAPAPEPPAPDLLPDLDDMADRLAALQKLQGFLREFLSRSNPYRKAFDLIHQMLKMNKIIPPAMLRSMYPYLDDLITILMPQLSIVSSQGDVPLSLQTELSQCCEILSNPGLTPQEVKSEALGHMDKVLEILNELNETVSTAIARYSAA